MKTVFTNPNEYDLREATKPRRYWFLHSSCAIKLGVERFIWTEGFRRSVKGLGFDKSSPRYIMDLIDNKVIFSDLTLRELEMINKRAWPIKEKMLQAIEQRAKAKKAKRAMGL
jgi:hypothetical protein